jgi:hypothetical protein
MFCWLQKVKPVFGPYVAYGGITCKILNEKNNAPQWIKEKAVFVTSEPVLVKCTTQDPATPYKWAKALSNSIAGSHLIRLKVEGYEAMAGVRLILMIQLILT